MTEQWSDVAPRYVGLKGWFWQLPYLTPTYEFMAVYLSFRIITLQDAKDILDAAW